MHGRHLGYKNVAVIEGWPQNRGFLSTILNGNAVGTKVSGRYGEGGRLSGVAVKRGSTGSTLLHTGMSITVFDFLLSVGNQGHWSSSHAP